MMSSAFMFVSSGLHVLLTIERSDEFPEVGNTKVLGSAIDELADKQQLTRKSCWPAVKAPWHLNTAGAEFAVPKLALSCRAASDLVMERRHATWCIALFYQDSTDDPAMDH